MHLHFNAIHILAMNRRFWLLEVGVCEVSYPRGISEPVGGQFCWCCTCAKGHAL